MALATTTLSAAVAVNDTSITVASATSAAAGRLVLIDQELMVIAQNYPGTGTTIPVLRGRFGTATLAHKVTANATHGLASDFADPAYGNQLNSVYSTLRPTIITSITAATSTLTLPTAGTDMRVVINLATAIALTVPVPTKDMDGVMLTIVSSTVAAHVVTFTGGLGGVGSGYTALTAATGAQMCVQVIACNGTWNVCSGPAWTGTVTKVTAGIA
jgi:hypothetical protein